MSHASPPFDSQSPPAVAGRVASPAPATFYLSSRWTPIIMCVSQLTLFTVGGYPLLGLLFALIWATSVVKALTWRLDVSQDSLRLCDWRGERRRDWSDFSSVELAPYANRRVICLVHQQHAQPAADRRHAGLPEHLRGRCTALFDHWQKPDELERLVRCHIERPAAHEPGSAWLVPAAPPVERHRLFWQILGFGSALALILMFVLMILF